MLEHFSNLNQQNVFSRPRVDITVNTDSFEVAGKPSSSSFAPVFHVTRRAAPLEGKSKWVILNAPGREPIQPAQYALHLFDRQQWPRDAVSGWGDLVALMFASLLPKRSALPWRKPDVHVQVRAVMPLVDREEFETRGRDALLRLGAKSVDFKWHRERPID